MKEKLINKDLKKMDEVSRQKAINELFALIDSQNPNDTELFTKFSGALDDIFDKRK